MSSCIFIFRRDFRTYDNIMLAKAAKTHAKIIPIFIFNDLQLNQTTNKYASPRQLQFMYESLASLCKQLPELQFFVTKKHFHDAKIIQSILRKYKTSHNITSIAWNCDYTPYARKRDTNLENACKAAGLQVLTSFEDYSLVDPSIMPKPYQVFTPFYKKYCKSKTLTLKENPSPNPSIFLRLKGSRNQVTLDYMKKFFKPQAGNAVIGGRTNAEAILKQIKSGKFKQYSRNRDLLFLENGTTKLSAYLKFGCISVREAFNVAHNNKSLQREMFWRSFYDQITYYFPQVLKGKSLRPKYDRIKWTNNKSYINSWRNGTTGFPVVDAGMRQLNKTGYMHNRARMIVASFLIKNLQCDWRIGEKYFASKLIDYYPASNSGGWQWASGGGADAQQYNRIFNPWIQSKKYDPKCQYIKRWIPELETIPEKQVHNWYKFYSAHKNTKYPKPIVDFSESTKTAKEIYAKALY